MYLYQLETYLIFDLSVYKFKIDFLFYELTSKIHLYVESICPRFPKYSLQHTR